jgi:hypothetical protein
MRLHLSRCVSSLLFMLALAAPAAAQSDAPVGVRAAGMGGAFTAVADDASAVFWNPAGLASASFLSLVADRNALDRSSGLLIAFGIPPLGISYYRTATAELLSGRNNLVAHHTGVTLLQTLGRGVAVGTTLKVVHGVLSVPHGESASSTAFDADLGVMAAGPLIQAGLSVRNVRQPRFVAGETSARLDRRIRAGLAVHARQDTLVAVDLDLTKTGTARGDWRDVALGVEVHPVRAASLRSGVHWNTAGSEAAPIGSVGGSYAVYGSVIADAQWSFGSERGERGWGVGLRFVY